MFGNLLELSEREIDKIIDRVLTNKRVQAISNRVADLLVERVLDRLSEGLKSLDKD
jgi:hypothetical protein